MNEAEKLLNWINLRLGHIRSEVLPELSAKHVTQLKKAARSIGKLSSDLNRAIERLDQGLLQYLPKPFNEFLPQTAKINGSHKWDDSSDTIMDFDPVAFNDVFKKCLKDASSLANYKATEYMTITTRNLESSAAVGAFFAIFDRCRARWSPEERVKDQYFDDRAEFVSIICSLAGIAELSLTKGTARGYRNASRLIKASRAYKTREVEEYIEKSIDPNDPP